VLLDRLEPSDLPVEAGRYRLLRLLGEGGMARVFEAAERLPDGGTRAIALKVVRAHVADDATRAALQREAKLGAMLHHPNIVQTQALVEVHGQLAIVLELVDGPTVAELLATGPLPPADAIAIGRGIAAALAHAHTAHERGRLVRLVHRDLKPANVLVSSRGGVKVSDFGIAKAENVASTTQTGMTKGTPLYMSPEQLEGADVDARSDLFSLGTMLWELLLGERLHRGDSLPAVVMSTMQVDERLAAPGVLARLDAVAPGLGTVVSRCLRRERRERFASAAEVARALSEVAGALGKSDLRGLLAARGFEAAGGSVSAALGPTQPITSASMRTARGVIWEERAGSVGPPAAASAASSPEPPAALRSAPESRGGGWIGGVVGGLLALGVSAAVLWGGVGERAPADEGALPEAGADGDLTVAPPALPVLAPSEPEAVPPPRPATGADRGRELTSRPARPASAEPAVPTPEAPRDSARDGESADALAPARVASGPAEAVPAADGGGAEGAQTAGGDVESSRDAGLDPAVPPSSEPPPAPLAGPQIEWADTERLPTRAGRLGVRFVVRATCGDGCLASLHTRPTGRDWTELAMKRTADGFVAEQRFPGSGAGHVDWYIDVRDRDGRVRSGSAQRPNDVRVR